ncbi:hypothetical protein [Massilia niastensis]|uniref:hypothetical protein n=1 Tax=Massilia niastensis TaxID=544911 RepID=UPI000368CCDC|nr:hypothetical protein [Massilia niastensis]
MSALAGVLYLLSCAFVAMRLLAAIVSPRETRTGVKIQIFTTLFFIFFYTNFLLLGYISLFTGQGVVAVEYALLIAMPVAIAVAIYLPVSQRALLHEVSVGAGALASSRIVAGTAVIFASAGVLSMFGYPRGFEVSAYHLPGAVEILRTATLKPWDGNFPHTFPANASLYTAFLFSFLPEKIVSSANLVFLFPLVVGTYTLGRLAGADRNASLLASCGLLSVPMIAFSSVELSADIGGIAFIVLAMSFALMQGMDRRIALALAGACAGLALGFKSMHLISIGFIGLLILCAYPAPERASTPGWREKILGACIFAGVTIFTCGFWLVRNYLAFDNPFYPVNLPLAGDLLGWARAADIDFSQRHATQFEWVRTPAEWLAYPWIEWHMLGQNFKHSSGLGAFFATTVPVSLAVVTASLFMRGRPRNAVRGILLLTIAFVIGTWWLLDDHQPRYALAAIAYCMPLVAWVISQAHPRWRPVLDAFLTVCIAVMLSIFFSKELISFADRILLSGHTTRSLYYEYPEKIDHLPDGARILNLAGRSWHYPLAGAGFRNQVISMPEGRRILGLPPSLEPPGSVTLDSRVLREQRISHVFLAGAKFTVDACITLEEKGRWDRNPKNGVMLTSPRIVYALIYETANGCLSADKDRDVQAAIH